MVKVYKTNVNEYSKAKSILSAIREKIPGSNPSFDLEDYDKVLRIETPSTEIEEHNIRDILQIHGYEMETLL